MTNGEPPRSEPRPSARGQPSEPQPSARDNTTSSNPQHHQETPPIPPRWRRVKRTLLTAGIVLIALLCLRLAWGCEADRRLRAKIAQYHAAGEPVLIEDFQRRPLADSENAAVLYRRAQVALIDTRQEKIPQADGIPLVIELDTMTRKPELIPSYPGPFERLLEANAQSLALAHEARQRSACDWNLPLRSPIVLMGVGSLWGQRLFARLLSGAAACNHKLGNDALAVEQLRDGLAHADRVHDPRGLLIGYFIAVGCEALLMRQVQRIAADLVVADIEKQQKQPARRDQVMALITELLDEAPMRESWRAVWLGERLKVWDTASAVCTGQLTFQDSMTRTTSTPAVWEAPVRLLLSPLWRLDAIKMLEHGTQMGRAGLASNWPQAAARAPEALHAHTGLRRLVHCSLLTFAARSIDSSVLSSHYRALANRRMAATALAIRLYEVDLGRRPASLDQLVPEYLPAVPADPFSADDQPLRYAPDAERPVLYSIGPNGVDDGGYRVYVGYYQIDWEQSDVPCALDGGDAPRRYADEQTPTTSQQAADDNGNEQEGSRDAGESQGTGDDPK